MSKLWGKTKDTCLRNCGFRVNAVIAALVPAVDYLQGMMPLLREHLPGDMYGLGFVVLALVNAALHVRFPVENLHQKKGEEE